MKDTKYHPRITVVGIGGVGGYVAAMLASRYPGVTVIARGKRKEAIVENGLVLHSDYKGEIRANPFAVAEPGSTLPTQDYVFVCVKNYSLPDALEEMSPYIDEHTVIVPVMNGVDPGSRIRSRFSVGTVVDSLIYIVSYTLPDASVVQEGKFAQIRIGIMHADSKEQDALNRVQKLLFEAGIDCVSSDDIEAEIWKKFILNCAYNVLTTYYNEPIGMLRIDQKKSAEYETLVKEAYQMALSKGVHVTDADISAILRRFYLELEEDATSSLQRDYHSGRKTELETFSGYLVKEAEKMGIELPLTTALYEKLK